MFHTMRKTSDPEMLGKERGKNIFKDKHVEATERKKMPGNRTQEREKEGVIMRVLRKLEGFGVIEERILRKER